MSKRRKILIFLISILAIFAIAIFVLSVLIKKPAFQTKIAQYYTNKLSNKLGTQVVVDSVNASLFKKFTVYGLYVEDKKGATLLYARKLKTNASHFAPFKKSFNLNNTVLEGITINLNRKADSDQFNIDEVFQKKETKTGTSDKKKPLKLTMRNARLVDVKLRLKDDYKNQENFIYLPDAEIDFDKFDLQKKIINAGKLHFHEPHIELIKTGEKGESESKPFVLPAWDLKIKALTIDSGRFINLTRAREVGKEKELSFSDLDLSNLQANLKRVRTNDSTINADIKELSFTDKSGFELSNLTADLGLGAELMTFEKLQVETPKSELIGSLSFGYTTFDDFSDFNDGIKLRAAIEKSRLSPTDLDRLFGKSPVDEDIELSGNFKGRVSDLQARPFNLKFSHGSFARGSLNAIGLPDLANTFFDASIDGLQTTPNGLRIITGKRNLSDKITNLGTVNYSGKFTGFLSDLVTYGTLTTSLGTLNTDINYSKKPGQLARYSGDIKTNSFQLGRWLNKNELGELAFNAHVNGSGFDLNSMVTSVNGNIQNIHYKGYSYNNIELKGEINKNVITAKLNAGDTYLNGYVEGSADLRGAKPAFDIETSMQNADLYRLGLIKTPLAVNTNLKARFSGNNLYNLLGNIEAEHIIINDGKEEFEIDDLKVNAYDEDGKRVLDMHTENIHASFVGEYDYVQLLPTIKKTINNYYYINDKWASNKNTITGNQQIGFKFRIDKTGNLVKYLLPDLELSNTLSAVGTLNPGTDELAITAQADEIKFGQYRFENWAFNAKGDGDILFAKSEQINIHNGASLWLNNSEIDFKLANNILDTHIKSYNENFLDADLTTRVKRIGDKFNISILSSDLLINGERWEVSPKNSITLGKNFWQAENFKIINGEQEIQIYNPQSDLNTKLIAQFANLELIDINSFISITGKPIGGKVNGSVNLVELNGKPNLDIAIVVNDLMYNNDRAAIVSIDGFYNIDAKAGDFDGIIQDEDYQVGINGGIDLKAEGDMVNFGFEIFRGSLHPFESLWAPAVENIDGHASGYLNFHGRPGKFNLNGNITMEDDLGLTIGFTQARYTIPAAQSIQVFDNEFKINSLDLYDELGNYASVSGSINHFYLNDFNVDVIAVTPKLMFLNTTAADNPTLYGSAFASGNVHFFGPVKDVTMAVNATSEPNTQIFINTTSNKKTGSYSFVKFRDKKKADVDEEAAPVKQKGKLTMLFGLDINQNAEANILFDEAGDNALKGFGNGKLNIIYDTEGKFEMNGLYIVNSGSYNFNYNNLFTRKFELVPGGTVAWSGDPFNALINVNANYITDQPDVNTLFGQPVSASSNVTTTLAINLGGPLSEPNLDFNISVDGAGSNVDALMEEQVNGEPGVVQTQVASILLSENFTPLGEGSTSENGNALTSVAVNTLTGIVTRHFNVLLQELGLLKNADLKIGYQGDLGTSTSTIGQGEEINIKLKQAILNGRATLIVGGDLNLDQQSIQDQGGLVLGDVIFSYFIKNNGNIQFRVFSKRDFDLINQQDKRRNGFGFLFKKEFDSFSELFAKNKQEKEEISTDKDQAEADVIKEDEDENGSQ